MPRQIINYIKYMNTNLSHLEKCLAAIPQSDYPSHSRIHRLRSFHFPFNQCYVKRDDELGFGISGSKIRKYRSLIPYLIVNHIQEVVIIGSAYSNHVLSFVQLLIENGLQPTLFLRGDVNRSSQGNALLTSLFIPSSSIHWLSQSDWKNVESLASFYASKQNHPIFLLPEGAFCSAALPGALTLVTDLLKNEFEHHIKFDHLFIEAGTGFTASTLLLGLNWIQHPIHVHIILLAEEEEAFLKRLNSCYEMFTSFIQTTSTLPCHFTLHSPLYAKGFGQIHSSLFQTILSLARQEGFLTDPIYSAKLFIESKRIIAQQELQGNILIQHSGGSLTLMGFQHHLQKLFV